MVATSPTQPHCRCCGKAIKKTTITHYFGQPDHLAGQRNSWSAYHAETATTKAEAQRQCNHPVVAIRRGYGGQVVAFTWDGESYHDTTFCSQDCAAGFGRMAALSYPHLRTQAAADAAQKRGEP